MTAVVVVASLISIARAKARTFDSSFSTILRTTRNPELDVLVASTGSSCTAPLAKQLAETKLRLVDAEATHEDFDSINDEDDLAPRTFFMVVRKGESKSDADDPVEQNVKHHKQKMRLTDVDSLLIVDEDSHQHGHT